MNKQGFYSSYSTAKLYEASHNKIYCVCCALKLLFSIVFRSCTTSSMELRHHPISLHHIYHNTVILLLISSTVRSRKLQAASGFPTVLPFFGAASPPPRDYWGKLFCWLYIRAWKLSTSLYLVNNSFAQACRVTTWNKVCLWCPPKFCLHVLPQPLFINKLGHITSTQGHVVSSFRESRKQNPIYLEWFSPACTSGRRLSSSAHSGRSRAAAANGRSCSGWCLESSHTSY